MVDLNLLRPLGYSLPKTEGGLPRNSLVLVLGNGFYVLPALARYLGASATVTPFRPGCALASRAPSMGASYGSGWMFS